MFNPDTYVKELVRQGKSLEDAREGGCSGCIEVGAFGKEAYLLTGYLNTPKILEITLNNGIDPETGKKIGLETGDPRGFKTFEELYDAWHKQMEYFVNLKLSVNNYIERMFSLYAPAPVHRGLHRQGQGLLQRRRPVQHHLHPVHGPRHHHGLLHHPEEARVRDRALHDGPAAGRGGR